MNEENLLIKTLKGKQVSRKAFWLMRQAGRYLPEYREVRNKAEGFLNLCFNPDLATEVTLQPIRRFDMDAAIVFSDILVVPQALGQTLVFQEGEGPRLGQYQNAETFAEIDNISFQNKLSPVYETVTKIKQQLPLDKSLIGFAGAPWTVACYMVQGQGDKTFDKVKNYAHTNKEDFNQLINILIEKTVHHLSCQIEQGADVVQLFDSWAGLLNEEDLFNYSICPIAEITKALKQKYPHIPVIAFPKGIKNHSDFIKQTNIDCLSISSDADFKSILHEIDNKAVIQGNLSPDVLLRGGAELEYKTKEILDCAQNYNFIFNLGHGVLKETPPEHVALLSKLVREHGN